MAFKLHGKVDIAAIESVCRMLLLEHPVLRTRLVEVDGEPQQQVARTLGELSDHLEVVSPAYRDESELNRQLKALSVRPFDLQNGVLARFAFLPAANDLPPVLLLVAHHMIVDGTSMMLLMGSLTAACNKVAEGYIEQAQVDEREVSFHHFVEWEKQMLDSAEGAEHLAYWQHQLAGELPQLQLPSDVSGKACGGTFEWRIEGAQAEPIKAFIKAHRLSGSAFFLSLYQWLLATYSGQRDIIVGMPTMGRPQPKFHTLVGYFINMVALRTDVEPALAFADFARQVQFTLFDALDHAQYPFTQLVKALGIAREADSAPVYQVFYAYQNFIKGNGFAGEDNQALQLEYIETLSQEGEYDLGLEVYETGESYRLQWKYNAGLFSKRQISMLAESMQWLSQSALKAPQQSIAALGAVLAERQSTELGDWYENPRPYRREGSIVSLFAQAVEAYPEATAVVADERQLSYRELDSLSDALACRLCSSVPGKGRVGVYCSRSIEAIVALLAIVKSGHCYVPLDPNYPAARLTHMVADCQIETVLSRSDMDWPQALGECRRIDVDKPDTTNDRTSDETVTLPPVGPDDLAYITYTSGSTGVPKGVMIPHRAVVRLVDKTDFMPLGPQTAFLQAASITFDAATLEIWAPLLNGGKLVVYTPDLLDATALAQTIIDNEVNSAWMTARYFDLFIESWHQALPSLNYLLVGGDVVSPVSVAEAYRRFPGLSVVNGYGPTENTTFSCCHLIMPDDLNRPALPIGKPIANSSAYILDEQQRPCPTWVAGALYLGGDGLAQGYLNRPEQTDEVFIAHPFKAGERLYRSGDMARYRDDGVIEYLGRADGQVKIRGFRVETAEIETALVAHPAVAQAYVQWQVKAQRLIAYVVCSAIEGLAEQLGEHLKARLPAFMLPDGYVALDALPLNANGKIDKAALAELTPEQATVDAVEAATTEREKQLCAIWQSLLDCPEVGINQSFFALGGHSLLATRLVNRLHQEMGLTVAVRDIFECQSIAALLARIEGGDKSDNGNRDVIETDWTGPWPLSFAQQRLWFIEQLEPVAGLYNIPMYFALEGSLNVLALVRALNALVQRHQVLASVYRSEGDDTYATLLEQPKVPFERVDLTALDSEQQARALVRQYRDMASHRFDLTRDVMMAAKLVQLAPSQAQLLLCFHHIAVDGWSMGVLLQDLDRLYRGFCCNELPVLEPLPCQYQDYARWQRIWLERPEQQQTLEYWQQQLGGAPACHQLMPDYPRPPRQSFAGAAFEQLLPLSTFNRLKVLGEANDASLFMVLHAALSLLLSRLGATDDIVVGTPAAGRDRAELSALVGFFVNTLALRVKVQPQWRFVDLLAQAKQTLLGAMEHQQYPFERILDELDVERSLAHNPVVQVMLTLENQLDSRYPLGELSLTALPMAGAPVAKFDLSLMVKPINEGMLLYWEYATDLFSRDTIACYAECFATLLNNIVEMPEEVVRRIPLLGGAEAERLSQWQVNLGLGKDESFDRSQTIISLFAEQVASAPDATALIADDEQMSYQTLDLRSDTLAMDLISQGVKPGDYVGLMMARGIDSIVALLAVLKAGAAYVPLDPDCPALQLDFICLDAEVSLVLSHSKTDKSVLPDGVATIDVDRWQFSGQSVELPSVGADDLAYLIYTSSATGTPKGVMIEHRGVNRQVKHADYLPLGRDTRYLHCASMSLDAAPLEIFSGLLSGGTVVIYTPAKLDIEQVACVINREQVTTALFTSHFFELFVNGWDHLLALKHLLVGGGVVSTEAAALAFERYPKLCLYNAYGPTENTTISCCYRIRREDCRNRALPIGAPIAHSSAYILDENQQPVPAMVVGELYLGGEGLARGYLNRPELTKLAFVEHPQKPGERLYRSGDLARYRPDGAIELIGRADSQVEIHGFTVELREIEAALYSHPEVDQAHVALRSETRQLIAYVACERGEPGVAGLLQHVEAKLPAFMCPSAYVTLKSMPLTPNGKLDTAALYRLTPKLSLEQDYLAPQTSQERHMCDIWQQVLGVEHIGVNHSFFALGGNSLLATRLINRLRSELHIQVGVVDVFEGQTVRGLVLRCDEARALMNEQLLEKHQEPLPLSFEQQRMWSMAERSNVPGLYNVPLGLKLDGPVDVEALDAALNDLVARNEILRTVYIERADGVEPEVLAHWTPPLSVLDLTALSPFMAEQRLGQCQSQLAMWPFDLRRDLPVAARLVQLGDQQAELLLSFHHIAVDRSSLGVLLRQLVQCYEFRSALQAPALEPLPRQYQNYAAMQQLNAEGQPFGQSMAYWQQQLASAPVCHSLILDFARPAIQDLRSDSLILPLDNAVLDNLSELAARHNASLLMLLYAAFALLLAQMGESDDIVVATPDAGRDSADLTDMVGLFVNTLVLRMAVDQTITFESLLTQAREVVLAAFEHKRVPFEKLVEQLSLKGTRAHNPLVQVSLALEPFDTQGGLSLGEASLTPTLPPSLSIGHFDLSFTVRQSRLQSVLHIEYATSLFRRETIERYGRYFRHLLGAINEAPQSVAGRLPLAYEGDYIDRLRLVNQRPYAECAGIIELFAEQAALHGECEAVVADDRSLDYATLERLSDELAMDLIGLGATPGGRTGLLMSRSVDAIVAMLAVLKTGGAYVPLDPNYPDERLAYMCADAEVELVLTQTTMTRPPLGERCRFFEVDRWQYSGEVRPLPKVDSEALGYLIYTSGSTGKPKGVMVKQGGLVRLVNHTDYVPLGVETRYLHCSSISFDAAPMEIFSALLNGGTVVVHTPLTLEVDALVETINHHQANTSFLTARFFDLLVAQWHGPLALRHLMVGGDVVLPRSAEQAMGQYPGIEIINLYGPTENATASCTYNVKPSDLSRAILPIGKPIANSSAWILDAQGLLCPPLVVGELYLGGPGLAAGYLNRESLTDEVFIDHPGLAGVKVYKTGDLARFRLDGEIEYIGRKDLQIKIRGFRVELGEIEAALCAHPSVEQAHVRFDRQTQSLFGYVASTQQDGLALQLKDHLTDVLPDYMQPAGIAVLDSLPLTPNGKLDTARLAAIRVELLALDKIDAGSALESELVSIWSELLKLDSERIGVTHNFFELGGNSIMAGRLLAQIKARLGVKVPMVVLFEQPTIRQLSRYLDACASQTGTESDADEVIELLKDGDGAVPPVYLVHPVGGDIWCYMPLTKALSYSGRVYGIRNIEAFERIEDMALDYAERIVEQAGGAPIYLGGWSMGGVVALEIARALAQRQDAPEVLSVSLIDSYNPADPAVAAVADDGQQPQILLGILCAEMGIQGVESAIAESAQVDDTLLAQVVAAGIDQQCLPQDFDTAQLGQKLNRLTRNNRAFWAYRPKSLDILVMLFKAELGAVGSCTNGWESIVDIDVVEGVPGNHFTILDVALAKALDKRIEGSCNDS